jgi:hypothetical protein
MITDKQYFSYIVFKGKFPIFSINYDMVKCSLNAVKHQSMNQFTPNISISKIDEIVDIVRIWW